MPVDANWAGWSKTRKRSSGALIECLGAPESELGAIGSGVAEGLRIRSCLLEAGLSNNVTL